MIVETHGLTKVYQRTLAVDGLDLAIPEGGGISAILGPNGSGKTTTIKILLGLAHATSGDASVFGLPASDDLASVTIRRRTGYVGEDKRLYGYMRVGEILSFVQSVYPDWDQNRAKELVEQFNLPLDRKCGKLSKGMRTKLALVLALARRAELLILDEPSEGLDPGSSEQLMGAVVRAAAEGSTVIFSTHQIPEAERIADHIFIINRGHLAFQASMDEMRANHRQVHIAFPGLVPLEEMSLAGTERVRVAGHVLSFVVTSSVETVVQRANSLGALSVDVQPRNLREIFLETVAGDCP